MHWEIGPDESFSNTLSKATRQRGIHTNKDNSKHMKRESWFAQHGNPARNCPDGNNEVADVSSCGSEELAVCRARLQRVGDARPICPRLANPTRIWFAEITPSRSSGFWRAGDAATTASNLDPLSCGRNEQSDVNSDSLEPAGASCAPSPAGNLIGGHHQWWPRVSGAKCDLSNL